MKKIIITGNSGKTIFSYFLAQKMSKTQKVVLVSTDSEKSIFKCLFPLSTEKDNEKSLAKLLADPVVTKKDIYENSHIINDNLLLICNREIQENFPEPTQINCAKLFMGIDSIADTLIIDTSDSLFDKYVMASQKKTIISVTTKDLRGYHYRLKHGESDINFFWGKETEQDIGKTFKEKPLSLPFVKQFSAIYSTDDINNISLPKKYKNLVNLCVEKIEKENLSENEATNV
ncbi:MAG: hypothetical protein R3Y33_01815 [Clostridia bacterium]